MIFNCEHKMRVQKKQKRLAMKLTSDKACKDLKRSLELGFLIMNNKLRNSVLNGSSGNMLKEIN